MSAFAAAFQRASHTVTTAQRMRAIQGSGSGGSLISDDGDDDSFVDILRMSEEEEDEDEYHQRQRASPADAFSNLHIADSAAASVPRQRIPPPVAMDANEEHGQRVALALRNAREASPPVRSDRNCPLCIAEQLVLRERRDAQDAAEARARGGVAGLRTAQSAMLKQHQNLNTVIFNYEEMMCGWQSDETIFAGMLHLRREYIERHLDEHGIDYQPWTLAMIRRHFDVRYNHRFDPVRLLVSEITAVRNLGESIERVGYYRPDPQGGEEPLFDVRISRERIQVSKQIQSLMKDLRAEMDRAPRRASAEAARRTVGAAIASIRVGGLVGMEGNNGNANGDDMDIIGDIHDLGGF